MDPFSQYLIFAEPYIELSAFDIDFDTNFVVPAASAISSPTLSSQTLPSPALSSHPSSTSYVSSVDGQEQQQPVDPWSPEWSPWADQELLQLLLNADAGPATSSWDDDEGLGAMAGDAELPVGHTAGPQAEDATALPASASRGATPPITGAMPPLTLPVPVPGNHSESPAPSSSTSAALHNEQPTDDAQTVSAGSSPPALALVPTSPPAHSPVSSSTSRSSSQAARKSRAHPYALMCQHCAFVQESGRKWDLARHVKTHAPVRKKFVCGRGGCEEVFSRRDAVRRHQKNANARCALAQDDDV
ncbi:hypothetical protein FA95DRAFT_1573014 [Auriscalpium vulgare]|uniref:Uncharacterized protein n=1 Tax=Auriscalpium vulgare TaxID=40419 RepID=A0ACB8RS40_9AGAM|nr:hypothetical protein FA95DRAFT_1573014 [Auriscalpium vulgare]